jgi:TPR repeat protein
MIAKTLARLLLLGGMLAATATPGRSEPIEVGFMPPEIEIPTTAVCAPRISDENVITYWNNWDRKALPKRSTYETIRDMNRLRDIGAKRFEKIIGRMQELLPTIKANYTDEDALFDKVKLMLALGQSDEVRKQGLIQKLLAKKDLSTGIANTLADYLIQGKGVDPDRENGLNLKIHAAFGGNTDAILDLAGLTIRGEKIDQWEVEPELAVNMAFGSLVGALDEGICDRVGRIAREYDGGGDIVKANPVTSLAWYRLAADLGDSYAAWKVAEYNLLSEKIVKDNKVLLKYLTMAADGGNMTAILELGRTYAEGSIVDQDLKKAFYYYRIAEKAGNQVGLVRQIRLHEKMKDASPEDAAAYEAGLRKVIERKSPPPWAFARLARLIQIRDGVWQSMPEARMLLEKAVENGDVESRKDFVDLLLRESPDDAALIKAIDLLTDSIVNHGEINAIAKLERIYLCLTPKGPELASASYWSHTEDTAGNETLVLNATQAEQLSAVPDPLVIATLQTQALYGRASAMALYQRYLESTGHSEAVLKFWQARAEGQPGATAEAALLQFKLNLGRGQLAQAKQSIPLGDEPVSPDAGLSFARFLIENYASDKQSLELAKHILQPLADQGFGRAVSLIEEIEAAQSHSPSLTRDAYSEAMERRGDMAAQLLLAEAASDVANRDKYYRRAIGSQRCDYDDSMSLAEFAIRKYPQDASRWLTIATHIAADDQWRKVKIGELYLSLNTQESVKTALHMFDEARSKGEAAAYYRLVRYYSDSKSEAYNPRAAGDIFVELLQRSDTAAMPEKLLMLNSMKPEIRRQVSLRVDIKALYERSANTGQPVAMRELAKLMLLDSKDSRAAGKAFVWMKQAAQAGDAEAMYLLSQSYAIGSGTRPSLQEAQLWMRKAAEAGNPDAAHMLVLTEAGTGG